MKHSFGLDVLGSLRPGCKGRLALVAVIVDRAEVKRLLGHLSLFTEPIPVQSATDPPDLWTEAYDFHGAAPPRQAETHPCVRYPAGRDPNMIPARRSVLSALNEPFERRRRGRAAPPERSRSTATGGAG
jgi:hypothetical protein